jgi:hypothetical protein
VWPDSASANHFLGGLAESRGSCFTEYVAGVLHVVLHRLVEQLDLPVRGGTDAQPVIVDGDIGGFGKRQGSPEYVASEDRQRSRYLVAKQDLQ